MFWNSNNNQFLNDLSTDNNFVIFFNSLLHRSGRSDHWNACLFSFFWIGISSQRLVRPLQCIFNLYFLIGITLSGRCARWYAIISPIFLNCSDIVFSGQSDRCNGYIIFLISFCISAARVIVAVGFIDFFCFPCQRLNHTLRCDVAAHYSGFDQYYSGCLWPLRRCLTRTKSQRSVRAL